MPVEFLTDDGAAAYGRFAGPPSQADLERVFFLDDEDLALAGQRRGQHMKLGFALQLVTVRWLGTFLEDPLDVPGVVLEFMAEQLGVEDPSQVKRYAERRPTPFDHQREIRWVYQWKDFSDVEPEFAAWVAARSWTSGDGPKAIFTDGVGWLRERKVLLPGVTTLARLVAKVRDDTTKRLWGVLEGLLTAGQRYVLDQLLEVPPRSRVSDLERWRKGVPPRASGPTIIKALDQVAEIMGLELADLGAEALVPQRRLGELAKYGMRADASALRRHPDGRRLATLLATVRFLEGKSVDDTLELLDLLMAAELVNKAQNASDKEKVRKHPKLAKASARLAVAVKALFASDSWGGPEEEVRVAEVWEAIEAVVSRADLRAALVLVNDSVLPADATDPDDWRAELVGRYTTVSGLLKVLPEVITFGANAEGTPVLEAMKALPGVLAYRSRLPAPLIPGHLIDAEVVNGPWKRLVFGHPVRADASVNRHAYALCVLERFWRALKRREIYADASTRWRNPQAELLKGAQWEAVRSDALTALSLPADPDRLLAEHARTLDAALREVGGRLIANPDVRVDGSGKIHLTGVKAIEEPPSLVDLRARTTAMLPRVELPEVILEVMSWVPQMVEAFTAVSGGRSRLKDLPVSIAACLTAHSLNVGYRPIAKKGVEALERSRLSHVFQNYFRPETLSPANAPLVDKQADLPLAQAWGGGLVAAVDGMRFVVPVPAAFARPNRKYFGSKRGMTWLNAMNDRDMGRGAKVVSGTIRDSLHMVDVIFGLDDGDLPEIVVSDTGSYSDLVFGLLELLGISYRPALADLPDQKGWRISPSADYGPLGTFARGKIDLGKIRRNWEDILRSSPRSTPARCARTTSSPCCRQVATPPRSARRSPPTAGSSRPCTSWRSSTSTRPTGATSRTSATSRRTATPWPARSATARRASSITATNAAWRTRLGVLGLVLNCVTLWNTVYLDAAVRRLKAQGYAVREEDMARLSPFVHSHLGVHGTYTFALLDLAPGAIRDLRDPDATEDDDEI